MIKFLQEIKINPTSGEPITIGNYIINKSTAGKNEIRRYSWSDAISNNKISSQTRANSEKFFGRLGITPTKVYVENAENMHLSSYYIFGEYKGEPIIIARRQTENSSAGQTKVYSKYAVAQLSYINDDKIGMSSGQPVKSSSSFHDGYPTIKRVPNTKEIVLSILRINP